MLKRVSAALVVTLACGCSYSTGALRLGPDRYSILTNAAGMRGADAAQRMAYEEANRECAKTRKKLQVVSEQKGILGRPGAFDLTFLCVPGEQR